jgi:phage gpG-like protein
MADPKNVRGVEKLKRRIATIRSRLDLPEMTAEIGVLITRRTLERFEREVDPNEKRWADLSPNTLAKRRSSGYGNKKKLQRTGTLKGAIRPIRGGFGTVFGNTGAGVRIGIEDEETAKYAGPLNRGVPRKIPARRFLGIGPRDIASVDAMLRRRGEHAVS